MARGSSLVKECNQRGDPGAGSRPEGGIGSRRPGCRFWAEVAPRGVDPRDHPCLLASLVLALALAAHMFELYDADSGDLVGEITHDQLDVLTSALADGVVGDREYQIDPDSLEWLETEVDDATLVELCREALGSRRECRVRWEAA